MSSLYFMLTSAHTTSTRGTMMSRASESVRSKTLLIISFSSFSICPSSWLTSTIVRMSSSVGWFTFAFGSTRCRNKIPLDKTFVSAMSGVRTTISAFKIGAFRSASFSA